MKTKIIDNEADIATNVTAIGLNTTHRVSDGKDHSDVVLNNTHRGSNGNDHSNVVLNNTHRVSDGKDHSDVVLNNTHRGSDGKNHSDVVLNNTHRSSNGSDHTFIDQDVKSTASPEFIEITLNNRIYSDRPIGFHNKVGNFFATADANAAGCRLDDTHIAVIYQDSGIHYLATLVWDGTDFSVEGNRLVVVIGTSLYMDQIDTNTIAVVASTGTTFGDKLSTYTWSGSTWSLTGTPFTLATTFVLLASFGPTSNKVAVTGSFNQLRQYIWNGSVWTLFGTSLTTSGVWDLACLDSDLIMIANGTDNTTIVYRYFSTWVQLGQTLSYTGFKCIGVLDEVTAIGFDNTTGEERLIVLSWDGIKVRGSGGRDIDYVGEGGIYPSVFRFNSDEAVFVHGFSGVVRFEVIKLEKMLVTKE